MTEQDARKMAQAYFACAIADFRGRMQGIETAVARPRRGSPRRRSGSRRWRNEWRRRKKALEEVQRTVPYRTESEAHEAIAELDRMVNAAQVEIAGIKARIATIQEYQRGTANHSRPEETLPRLAMMYVEESIALQGTRAREEMATRLREQANRFLELTSTLRVPSRRSRRSRRIWRDDKTRWRPTGER